MAHASLPSLGELLLLSLLLLFGLAIKHKAIPALITVSQRQPAMGLLSWVICGAELGVNCVVATGMVLSQQQFSCSTCELNPASLHCTAKVASAGERWLPKVRTRQQIHAAARLASMHPSTARSPAAPLRDEQTPDLFCPVFFPPC